MKKSKAMRRFTEFLVIQGKLIKRLGEERVNWNKYHSGLSRLRDRFKIIDLCYLENVSIRTFYNGSREKAQQDSSFGSVEDRIEEVKKCQCGKFGV